jgi:hypothetical protein
VQVRGVSAVDHSSVAVFRCQGPGLSLSFTLYTASISSVAVFRCQGPGLSPKAAAAAASPAVLLPSYTLHTALIEA